MEQRRGGFEGFSSLGQPWMALPGSLPWAGAALTGRSSPSPHSLLQRTRPSPGYEANHGQNFRLILPGAPLLSASSPVGEGLCHPSHGSSTGIQPCHGVPLPTLTHGPARVTCRGEPFSLEQPPLGWSPLPSPATKCEDRLDPCALRQLEQAQTDGVGNCRGREGYSPFSSVGLCLS